MRAIAVSLLLFAGSLHAQYVQQGSRLRGMDAAGGEVGTSVALSFDGNTAVAGGPADHVRQGGAWIFTRNGRVWSQQGARLVSSGIDGDEARRGHSVAISDDGYTVLVGGPRKRLDDEYAGAVWVFTRVAGVWTEQGLPLVGTGAVGDAEQGTSVALSADGNTALVGGPGDNGSYGAAWVFTRSGDTWTQQGAKLVGFTLTGASAQGFAVALSGDGDTAIIGGPSGTDGGAVWIFTRTDGVWTQQGSKLIGIGGVSVPGIQIRHGASVALSHDGNTAVVGAPGDESERGSVWVYVRNVLGEWVQEGPKLGGTSENPGGRQGTSVSLSADGDTAVVGGHLDHPQGAIWVFTRDEGVWMQQGEKLVGTDAATSFGSPMQGRSVAISGDATTIVEGGPNDAAAGSVWPFAEPVPTIATVSGNGQTAKTGAAFATLTAVVRDAADQPVPNAPVTFTVHAGPGGASGTFGGSGSVLTGSNGIATAPPLTANGTVGGFTVTATTPSAPASATFNLASAALAAPANVIATASVGTLSVTVNWTPSSGATLYEVVRAQNGITYTTRTTTAATSFIDSSDVHENAGYLYKVRAVEPALSGFSAPDLATVVSLTDPSLDGKRVKGAHFMELRLAAHVVRSMSALPSPSYTDLHLAGEQVKAVHLTELRAALDEARARLMLPALLYARPTIAAGSTLIAKTDVLELRGGVQ